MQFLTTTTESYISLFFTLALMLVPVSYTHLDVYKRQPLVWSV